MFLLDDSNFRKVMKHKARFPWHVLTGWQWGSGLSPYWHWLDCVCVWVHTSNEQALAKELPKDVGRTTQLKQMSFKIPSSQQMHWGGCKKVAHDDLPFAMVLSFHSKTSWFQILFWLKTINISSVDPPKKRNFPIQMLSCLGVTTECEQHICDFLSNTRQPCRTAEFNTLCVRAPRKKDAKTIDVCVGSQRHPFSYSLGPICDSRPKSSIWNDTLVESFQHDVTRLDLESKV